MISLILERDPVLEKELLISTLVRDELLPTKPLPTQKVLGPFESVSISYDLIQSENGPVLRCAGSVWYEISDEPGEYLPWSDVVVREVAARSPLAGVQNEYAKILMGEVND